VEKIKVKAARGQILLKILLQQTQMQKYILLSLFQMKYKGNFEDMNLSFPQLALRIPALGPGVTQFAFSARTTRE
jgi:hypothetical protein